MDTNITIEKGLTKKSKELMQYASAIAMLISGSLMCWVSFVLNKYTIDSTVLFYMGECLVFAGGVFGFSIYVNTKIGTVKAEFEKKLQEIQKE